MRKLIGEYVLPVTLESLQPKMFFENKSKENRQYYFTYY